MTRTSELSNAPATGREGRTDPVRELRRFHLGEPGGPGGGLRGLEPGHGLLPVHLEPFRERSGEPSAIRTETPLFLGPPDGPTADLCVPLAELLERSAPPENRLLADNLRRLEGHVRRLAAEPAGRDGADGVKAPVDARDLLRRAGEAVIGELSLGDDDARKLSEGLDTLVSRVPEGGRLAPFGPRLPLDLLRQAATARAAEARAKTRTEVRRLGSELEGILAADDRQRGGGAPEALAGSLGALGSRRVRSESLSGLVDPGRGGAPLDDDLRRRLEEAVDAMRGLAADAGPPVLCVAAGNPADQPGLAGLLGVEEPPGWRVVASDDPCREAAARFDEGAEDAARVVRATQLARLSSEGRYEPARHDDWLDRLDWQALGADELALAPPVVALISADHAAREGMLSLSSLLLSGRPVQVVVMIRPGGSPGATGEGDDPLSGFRFEPGYHGLGHREAFVSQGSPARPVHLMETFRRAFAATRTALHVVAEVPRSGEPPGAYLRAAAALEGRAHALFRYDPEAGATWARRLDFSGNPDPELDWPTADEAGPFTFAHFALTEPAYADGFTPVPDGVPDDALAPLARWIELAGDERAGVVPTVEATDGAGRRTRLALTRRLALATGDRLSYWRTLQELAGVRSEYADRAAAEARREAEESARAEAESLAARHAAELERVRATAVRQAAERITSALLDVDPAVFESARSPFERFQGRDADEVSRDLLGMLGDPGGSDGIETPSGTDTGDDADRLAARLMQLIDDDTPAAETDDGGDSPSPDHG